MELILNQILPYDTPVPRSLLYWWGGLIGLSVLFGTGWLVADEEFFIVAAFLSFLVLGVRYVSGLLAETLDARIFQIQLTIVQSRDLALRGAVSVYQRTQNFLQLARLRSFVLSQLQAITLPILEARLVDREWIALELEYAAFRINQVAVQLLCRTVALNVFYETYGLMKDTTLLANFIREIEYQEQVPSLRMSQSMSETGVVEVHLELHLELVHHLLVEIEENGKTFWVEIEEGKEIPETSE